MKKYLIIILFLTLSTFAQTIDTLNFAPTDSVDIKAIVQQQIKEAIKKKSYIQQIALPIENKNNSLKIEKANTKNAPTAKVDLFAKIFASLPLQYKIYLSLSLIIILFVLLRRTLFQLKRKSTKKFKERIVLLREEKIGGSIVNKKKKQIRLKLKDNPITLKQNEKEIALSSKQLNISKGELLLAARLKLLEVSKAQRSL
ncbi:hypothetical protein [Stygiobacter electus]|uniref:Uncharacterized protein n=1 Tax=Stygiobacter electus TaxID=3032292 RepID=A0AAE3TDA3_9BACT|nr:hypothetical protein [Stygiobacter electus]MDF1611237.1 hypothetical protein [Stygiobacter electus]